MDLNRDEEVTASELYNRAMISKQDLQAEHAGGRAGWRPGLLEGRRSGAGGRPAGWLEAEAAEWSASVCVCGGVPAGAPSFRASLRHLLGSQTCSRSCPPRQPTRPSLWPTPAAHVPAADVLGVVLNKVPKRDHAIINAQLSKKLAAAGLPYAGGIPADATIGTARWAGWQPPGSCQRGAAHSAPSGTAVPAGSAMGCSSLASTAPLPNLPSQQASKRGLIVGGALLQAERDSSGAGGAAAVRLRRGHGLQCVLRTASTATAPHALPHCSCAAAGPLPAFLPDCISSASPAGAAGA